MVLPRFFVFCFTRDNVLRSPDHVPCPAFPDECFFETLKRLEFVEIGVAVSLTIEFVIHLPFRSRQRDFTANPRVCGPNGNANIQKCTFPSAAQTSVLNNSSILDYVATNDPSPK